MARRGFGAIRRLPAKTGPGRWQASYTGPDGHRYTARTDDDRPLTFNTQRRAENWLDDRWKEIKTDTWVPPHRRKPTIFRDYAERYVAGRKIGLRTREDYDWLLEKRIFPTFGKMTLREIRPVDVRTWHSSLNKNPTLQAKSYGLLRSIMKQAFDDELIDRSPCKIKGAGRSKVSGTYRHANADELATIVAHTPDRFKVMVLLAAWCSLRFGEVTALRRRDIDLTNGTVTVRHAITRVSGDRIQKGPKSDAGLRTTPINPDIIDRVRDHLTEHVGPRADDLMFPAHSGGYLAQSTMEGWFGKARAAAGRPDLRFHDLRSTGATWVAQNGGSIRDVMTMLGDSTPDVAAMYVRHDEDHLRKIVNAMAGQYVDDREITPAKVIPIDRKRKSA